jgi:hypothetical protein
MYPILTSALLKTLPTFKIEQFAPIV